MTNERTLRDLLAEAEPHFKPSRATTPLVRALRAWRRAGGRPRFASRAAVERDPTRIALAQRNARGLRVAFHQGEAEELVPALQRQHPGAARFLDPPWGGVDWDRQGMGWTDLVPEVLTACALAAPLVIAKLPRAFELDSLPPGRRWHLRWEFGRRETADADIVKMLTARSDDRT